MSDCITKNTTTRKYTDWVGWASPICNMLLGCCRWGSVVSGSVPQSAVKQISPCYLVNLLNQPLPLVPSPSVLPCIPTILIHIVQTSCLLYVIDDNKWIFLFCWMEVRIKVGAVWFWNKAWNWESTQKMRKCLRHESGQPLVLGQPTHREMSFKISIIVRGESTTNIMLEIYCL